MKTDAQIQKDVMEQLKWEPFLNSSAIGVSVKNGVVTLSGIVDSFSKKVATEKATKKISGVKAIAEDIQIGVSPSYRKTDAEIADAILNALKWNTAVQAEKIKIKVEDGIVTLDGEAEWDFQRSSASSSIENLAGVKSVNNLITLKPKVSITDVEKQITSAFHRSATIDANKIHCDVFGSTITLRGSVRSYVENKDAEYAAWNVPGVTSVINKLEIKVPEYAIED